MVIKVGSGLASFAQNLVGTILNLLVLMLTPACLKIKIALKAINIIKKETNQDPAVLALDYQPKIPMFYH